MEIRVVKPTQASEDEKAKKPTDEAQMMRAVQSWVKEFKSSKATSRKADVRRLQKR